MHNAWDPLIGWMAVIYIAISLASAPFLVGYAVYKAANMIRTKFERRDERRRIT